MTVAYPSHDTQLIILFITRMQGAVSHGETKGMKGYCHTAIAGATRADFNAKWLAKSFPKQESQYRYFHSAETYAR